MVSEAMTFCSFSFIFARCDALESEISFEGLGRHVPPILHTTLLIWKGSPYYNTTPRLVVLMQECSNALIRKAAAYLTGDRLFELMDGDEAGSAVEAIRTLLRVLGGFKVTSVYHSGVPP
jgi:dynein heavy chain, axonemal